MDNLIQLFGDNIINHARTGMGFGQSTSGGDDDSQVACAKAMSKIYSQLKNQNIY
jgi:hypothetical protein